MNTSQPLPSEGQDPGIPDRAGEPITARADGIVKRSQTTQKTNQEECVIVAPVTLGLESRAEFRSKAAALIDRLRFGQGRLVIDFCGTSSIDSAGLNTMAVLHRMASRKRITIVLMGMHGDLRAFFAVTKLEDLFAWQDADTL